MGQRVRTWVDPAGDGSGRVSMRLDPVPSGSTHHQGVAHVLDQCASGGPRASSSSGTTSLTIRSISAEGSATAIAQ